MNGCIYRTEDGKCKQFSVGGVLSFCYLDGTCDCQISSNADRIRAMSDEELANVLASVETGVNTYGDDVYSHWLSWLKDPVEVEE